MKKLLIFLITFLLTGILVHAENKIPSEIIAVKKSDNAVLAWRNPDCEMTFIKIYGVKLGKKTLIEDEFDTDANAVNEIDLVFGDFDEYVINFRCGDGSDRYYTVNKFIDATDKDTFIREWEIDYKEPAGVTVGLDRNDKKSGKSSLYITSDTLKYDAVSVSQCVCDIIDKEALYKIGFWIKASSADSIRVKLSYNERSDVLTFVPDVKDSVGEWKYVTYTFSGKYAGFVSFDASTYTHEIRIDDVTLYKLKNGRECGVNLLSNSAFTLADNTVNNEVLNLTAEKRRNKVILSWTNQNTADSDRILIYNGGKIVGEVSSNSTSVEIDYRECISDTYTVVVRDNKGNFSNGISVIPDETDKVLLYKESFDNEDSANDIEKVSFTGNYAVSDGILSIGKSKGIHILPSECADEFVYKVELKPNTNKNTRNLGIVFGYDEARKEYGVVSFNAGTMIIGKSDNSNIGAFTETFATVSAEADILSLDKMNNVKISQTADLFEVEVDGVTLYSGKSTALKGKFGFSTVGLLGIYVDDIEIKIPEPYDFAVYNDDFIKTGEIGFVNKQRPASVLTIEDEHLRYKENGGNSLWVLENGKELIDFTFDFDYTFKAYKYTSGNYCGIAFGYDDEAGTVYRIGLRNEGKIFFTKHDVINDTALVSYAEYPMNFEMDKTYRMRVSVKDGKMTLYRDGILVMEYSGEKFDYTGGSFGLISNGGGAEYKNILITPYNEEFAQNGKYHKDFSENSVLDENVVKLSGNVTVSEGVNGLNINSQDGTTVYAIDNLVSKKNFSYTSEFSMSEDSAEDAGFGLVFSSKYDYGYYRIMLKKGGKILFEKCNDKENITLKSIETGTDFTKTTSLKLIGLNNVLYVYVNNKLIFTADMKNEVGGFGFETVNTSATLNSISVNDVINVDFAAIEGYFAVIEDISVNKGEVTFKTSAGLDVNNAYLVGAVYDGTTLKCVDIINSVTIRNGEEKEYTFTFNESVTDCTVKIMLFEDLDKITPMAKALKK